MAALNSWIIFRLLKYLDFCSFLFLGALFSSGVCIFDHFSFFSSTNRKFVSSIKKKGLHHLNDYLCFAVIFAWYFGAIMNLIIFSFGGLGFWMPLYSFIFSQWKLISYKKKIIIADLCPLFTHFSSKFLKFFIWSLNLTCTGRMMSSKNMLLMHFVA